MIPSIENGRVHLLGIGGTAMASLAGLLKELGVNVSGSDQNLYPPMSDLLDELGIDVRSPYDAANLPAECDLVVIGNAISRGNPELESVLSRRLPYASMPEVLKEVFLRERRPIVVAGTHGKTTTSSLVSWLLQSAGQEPGFLIGGIPLNFDSSYRTGTGEGFVVEGDEYDTAYFDKGPKFLHYLPEVAILANIEFDHADIYRNVEEVERAFRLFVNLVPQNGLLVVGTDSERAAAIASRAPCPIVSYGVSGPADWTAEMVSSDTDGSRFRLLRDGRLVTEATGAFWGEAALRNVLAASVVADHFGASAVEIAKGLDSFKGVRRRLEVRGCERGVIVVDDFAHHPTAIRETLAAARRRWADRRIWGVFEPRSYTARSRVFQDELAEALSSADAVVVARVFRSARLPEEEELSEEKLVADLAENGVPASFVPEPDRIVELLDREATVGDVVLVMSNGGFGGLHGKLLHALRRQA